MKKFNINAPVREYQDNQGQKKTQWYTVGHLIVSDEQLAAHISQNPKNMFIAIESVPVGSQTWDGRCGIFEPQQAQAHAQPQYQQQQPQYQQPAPQAQYPQQQQKQYRDDLPF